MSHLGERDNTSSQASDPRQFRDRLELRYFQALGLVIVATLVGFPIQVYVSPTNLVMPYLVGVVIAASRLGRGPSIFGATLSVLAFDFFFVPPRFTLEVADTEYILTFLGLLLVGLVISTLVSQVREKTKTAQMREDQTAALYALSRDLTAASNVDEICAVVQGHIERIFALASMIWLSSDEDRTGPADIEAFTDQLISEATGHYEPQTTIDSPGTHPHISKPNVIFREPLTTSEGIIGAIGILSVDTTRTFPENQHSLLGAVASQASLAIERARLAEDAHEMEIVKAAERFQSALLGSISHDLRTPLATITGVLSSLQSREPDIPEGSRHELVETAYEEAERLNQFVGNLLEMTRIQGNALHLHIEETDIEDLIGIALTMLEGRLRHREIKIELDRELPLIELDLVLISQVLKNVLDNAAKYSPPNSPIEISALRDGENLDLRIADRGSGIPEEEIEHVFEKFYRVDDGSGTTGIGLGLSISRGIVEAHGGVITASNRHGGGAEIQILLPLISPSECPK